MRYLLTSALAFSLAGCGQTSGSESDEIAPILEEKIGGSAEAAQAAGEAVQEAMIGESSPRHQCSNFIDGSNRKDTLAGIAIGDQFDRVIKQIECGEVSFLWEKFDVNRGTIKIKGEMENEYIEVILIGVPGKEEVVEVSRDGDYRRVMGPSIDKFISNLYRRFPNLVEINKNRPHMYRREFGFSKTISGEYIADHQKIQNCGFRHTRGSGTGITCGLSFIVYLDPDLKRNPGLAEGFSANLSDESYEIDIKTTTDLALNIRERLRQKNEVIQAGDVKGF